LESLGLWFPPRSIWNVLVPAPIFTVFLLDGEKTAFIFFPNIFFYLIFSFTAGLRRYMLWRASDAQKLHGFF